MMDKQKVLDRVAKCFALANANGASLNEVETALRQARNLMKQYNLEAIEVAAHTIDEESVPTGTPQNHPS
jgi:regulator of PEP synthase PpsR (kinase-PPPase family)